MFIVIGKGVGFGKESGQMFQPGEVERIFKAENMGKGQKSVIDRAVENLNSDVLLLTEEISRKAAVVLNIPKFDDNHFLALADHLNYALKRSNKDTFDYPENLRWEVKKLYPKEHDIAIDTLYLIEKRTGIRLPISEQTYLTYHFVNVQYDAGVNIQSMRLAELINRAIEIIQYHYQTVLNQNSVNYIRFVTHLRYFVLRQIHRENAKVSIIDEQLITVVKKITAKPFRQLKK